VDRDRQDCRPAVPGSTTWLPFDWPFTKLKSAFRGFEAAVFCRPWGRFRQIIVHLNRFFLKALRF
jgi:hypothetical protein